jgi:rhodanese-related sulfurtransferase
VLGLQALGEGDAVKRVDVSTQWIAHGGTLEDLAHVEHAYAPPYAPAIDPLAVAAFAALNQEDGVTALSPDADLEASTGLDVRLADERERYGSPASGAAVPLTELRERLGEIASETSVAVCERGTRSAEAVRLLSSRGLRVSYLGGGLHWRNAMRPRDEDT